MIIDSNFHQRPINIFFGYDADNISIPFHKGFDAWTILRSIINIQTKK